MKIKTGSKQINSSARSALSTRRRVPELQHTWSVLACYLQSRPPSLIPAPYKLWYWAADTIRHRLDNAACKLWTASPRPAWTINGEIISPRCLQNVKETDIYLSFEMMKGYSELKYQMFHQIWFLSFALTFLRLLLIVGALMINLAIYVEKLSSHVSWPPL